MIKKVIIGVSLASIVLILVAGGLVGYFIYNPEMLKARLEQAIEANTGREFAITGPLSIDPGRVTSIHAEGIRLANAAWAENPELASIKRLQVSVDLWRYLADGQIVLPELRLDQPYIALERDAEGRLSWPDIGSKQEVDNGAATNLPIIKELAINGAKLAYHDAAAGVRIDTSLQSESAEAPRVGIKRLRLSGGGSLHDEPVSFNLVIDSPASSHEQSTPFQVDGAFDVARTTGTITGTLDAPLQLQGIELEISLDSPDPGPLLELAGLTVNRELPSVKLTALIERHEQIWQIADFAASAGRSDLTGMLVYDSSGERPRFQAKLNSELIDGVDLQHLIAAVEDASEDTSPKDEAGAPAPREKVEDGAAPMASQRVDLSPLNGIDAQIAYHAAEVRLPDYSIPDYSIPDYSIKDVAFEADLSQGIAAASLRAQNPGGAIQAELTADATTDQPEASIQLDLKNLRLQPFTTAFASNPGIGATIDATGSAELKGGDVESLLRQGTASLEVNAVDIDRPELDELEFALRLDDGVLVIDPLTVTLPGGKVTGRLQADAGGGTPQAQVVLGTDGLQLAALQEALSLPNAYQAVLTGEGSGTLRGTDMDTLLRESDFSLDASLSEIGVPGLNGGSFHALLQDGTLLLDPFELALSGGSLIGKGSADLTAETPQATIDITAQSLALRPLLEALAVKADIAATIDGTLTAELEGADLETILRRSTAELDATIAGIEAPQLEGQGAELDLEARLNHDSERPLTLSADGAIGDMPFGVDFSSSAPAHLFSEDPDFPLDLVVTLDEMKLAANGTVYRPWSMEGLAVDLSVEGQDPKRVMALFKLPAMELPPYRLAGNIAHENGLWRLTGIDGRIGDSDLSGNLDVDSSREVLSVRGDLASNNFDADDLGGLIGAQPGTGEGETETDAQEASAERADDDGQMLPDEPLQPQRWDNLDVDVGLTAKTVNALGLQLDSLDTRIRLQDGDLVIDPMNLALADGRIDGNILVGAGEIPVDTEIDVALTRLKFGDILRRLGVDTDAVGTLSGRAKGGTALTAQGRSIAEILGSSDGQVAFIMDGGSVNRLIIDALGLDFLGLFGSLFADGGETEVNCMLAEFTVDNGVMATKALVLDTEAAYVTGQGNIDLGEETLSLDLASDPKSANPFTGGATIQIRGTFAEPEVIPSPVSVLKNIFGGLTLGVLFSPFAAAIPAISGDVDESSGCGKLIETLRDNAE